LFPWQQTSEYFRLLKPAILAQFGLPERKMRSTTAPAFDRAIDPKVASARERFEAFSHSVRDVLAQRWVQTKTTYEQQNAKRIYYLSMEFLLGRSLANNITNLLLDPVAQYAVKDKGIDWLELIEQEPDAGLGNGGLGRLAACSDSMATMQLPLQVMVCATVRYVSAVICKRLAAGGARQLVARR
jgi:glucan phosphorylase